jgi:hypothetical protein
MDARTNPELEITEAEVVWLESKDVHIPYHAWQVVQRAIAAKRHDDYARKTGKKDEPLQLTPELSALAGLCQKVTINDESRKRFKKLYRNAFNNGMFKKNEDGSYVNATSWRINPHGV